MIPSVLLTDLYQLTMANGYFKLGLHNKQACFQHFFRRHPFGSGFTVAAGLNDFLEFVSNWSFTQDDLAYLENLSTSQGQPLLDSEFLGYLGQLKLEITVDAILEGTVVFPKEPLLKIRGPLLQCQMLETALLNMVNFQSLIATKSARCVLAARGKEIVDFGMRRAQGPNGAVSASRAAFIGGCLSTSNVLAGKLFSIPVKGTQAHSWIMAFGDEKEAFRRYAEVYPDDVYLLVDTYHTKTGIENAIKIAIELRKQGRFLRGIRLDSGNLLELSQMARAMLDAASFYTTKIMASGDLDEYRIDELVGAGAPIDIFGVGTRMVTGFDEPALGGVYKLVEMERADGQVEPIMKLSDDKEKSTLPSALQVRRYVRGGKIAGDLIYSEGKREPGLDNEELINAHGVDLLTRVFDASDVGRESDLSFAQNRVRKDLGMLEDDVVKLKDPAVFPVWIDSELANLQAQKTKAHRMNEEG